MSLKEKIVHESLRLFSRKGFLGTTIDDILRATDSSKGGFYNHFKNKEDLFFHVLDEARRIWRKRNLKGLNQSQRPLDNIKLFLDNFRDYYLKDSKNFPGGCIFITLLVELKEQSPHLAHEIYSGFIGMKSMLLRYLNNAQEAGHIKKSVDTEAMVEMIFNGILGTTISYNVDKSEEGVNKAIRSIHEYIESIET